MIVKPSSSYRPPADWPIANQIAGVNRFFYNAGHKCLNIDAMSIHALFDFDELFKKVTGNAPYPWQTRLYRMFLEAKFPEALGIPTGLGKTSVMTIWRLALATSTNARIPTRLVYIVDRRAIVDQASAEAAKLHDALTGEKEICGKTAGLNISTLRGGGGLADNREWLLQPDVPAIIIGTVDMIGSRLLFSGYGVNSRIRSFYAGLLGQDSLIILDETHLSPAMERTLKDAKRIADKAKNKLFPPRIMLMSATQRSERSDDVFSLGGEDLADPRITERYRSAKNLKLVETDDVLQKVTDAALDMRGKVLVYLQKPRDVQEVASRLREHDKLVTLTGTMRGYERDLLAQKSEYKKFETSEKSDDRIFLVSTSAGEVGVDLDADNMVCDLTTLDSMIQRLGRVNRRGGRRSEITVVYSEDLIEKSRMREYLGRTRDILRNSSSSGTYNANPANIDRIAPDTKAEAFSPAPETQPLTYDILDMWSMTSLYGRYSSRPAVRHWLHGNPKAQIPETHVAWRDDVEKMARLNEGEILEILDSYRILPHETARDNMNNVYRLLQNMKGKKAIIQSGDRCEVREASMIKANELAFVTVLLPCSAGGLNGDGLLDATNKAVDDVADKYAARARVLVEQDENGEYRIKRMFGRDKAKQSDGALLESWMQENSRMILAHSANVGLPAEEDEPAEEIRYYVERSEQQRSTSSKKQTLQDHLNDVERNATRITRSLAIPNTEISKAVVTAAKFHDIGKAREHWQQCMRVPEEERPLAKTGKRTKPLPLGGFRHEFASVVEFRRMKANAHKEQDLILHLIAAHHGWARPCFRPDALIGNDPAEELHDTMQRYARLQRRFGPWGLAWLEGLLRGADWEASRILEGSGDGKR